jgi:RNA polymerase sigma-70 factor (ECF subfamily)
MYKRPENFDLILADLVKKAKEYDKNALAYICEYFYTRIYKFVFFKVANTNDAEDITSDVFVKMVNRIETQNGSFTSWLYKIATNTVIDYYRQRETKKTVEFNEKLKNNAQYHTKVEDDLTLEKIRESLDKLTEEQKEFITHKFFNGLDNKEISGIMNKTEETLRVLQYRALKALKEILK